MKCSFAENTAWFRRYFFPTLIINCQISNFLGSYSALVLQCLFCTWESKGVRTWMIKKTFSAVIVSFMTGTTSRNSSYLEKQRLGVFSHFSLKWANTPNCCLKPIRLWVVYLSEKTWLWVVCLFSKNSQSNCLNQIMNLAFFKNYPVQLPQSNNEFVVKTWCYLECSCRLWSIKN